MSGASGSPQPSLLWKTLQIPARIGTTLMFEVKTYGRQYVPADGGVLMVSNHQSYLDPVLLAVHLRRPMSYMAKSELFENPAFAWLIRSLHAYPVRQGEGDKSAIEETIRQLKAGSMLNIFPEGTRTNDGEIRPLERGIALIIRRAKTPVLPAVINGSFQAWPMGQKMFRAWPIEVCYGPVMDFAGCGREEITTAVEGMLRGMFDALRQTRGPAGQVDGPALDARVRQLWATHQPAIRPKTSAQTPEAISASTA